MAQPPVARIGQRSREELDQRQREVLDACIAGPRRRVPGPMIAWIASPNIAEQAQALGALLRYETTLPPKLSELAILITARHWSSHYEWQVHRREAVAAGVPEAVIAAIAARERPALDDPQMALVHDYAVGLLIDKAIPDALHHSFVAELGERAEVELVMLLGYYGLVSMTLNAFHLGLPAAWQEELSASAS